MARKRTRPSEEVEIIGGPEALMKLLTKFQKTGKQRLKDEQIKTGVFLRVGGVREQLVLGARKSDKCKFVHDMDPTDDIGPLRCDKD